MHVKVHYQGLDSTPWMEAFISEKIEKLQAFLTPASTIQTNIAFLKGVYTTNIIIHSHHDYSFKGRGENLYESFMNAKQMAVRALKENKRRIKDRINRKYHSSRELAA